MNTKESLHGAGVYYFALTGAKQQPIFRSVFEYDYAIELLANLKDTQLLAYVFDEYLMQCILRVPNDWVDTLSEIISAFDNLHERCWNKRIQVLSEQATVLHIDENAYLMPTILQLHDWPRYTGKVADASLWPYSSDLYYRQQEAPKWLHTDVMLNQLAHSRRNRDKHYQAVMQNPPGEQLDFIQGNQEHYLALARESYIQHYLDRTAPQLNVARLSTDNHQQLYQQACQIVAKHFGLNQEELLDKNKRQRFHHLMPLVVWLLRQRNVPFDDIAKFIDEDEVRLELWLRNLTADHSEHTKNRLHSQWAASF